MPLVSPLLMFLVDLDQPFDHRREAFLILTPYRLELQSHSAARGYVPHRRRSANLAVFHKKMQLDGRVHGADFPRFDE